MSTFRLSGGLAFWADSILACEVCSVKREGKAKDEVKQINSIHKAAKRAARRELSESARPHIRLRFEEKLGEMIAPYLADKNSVGHVLAKRMNKHMDELFTFIEYPGCPSENNAAERAVRPAVIARKISGGTRS